MLQLYRDNQKYFTYAAYIIFAFIFVMWLRPYIAEKTAVTIADRTIRGIQLGGIYAIIALGIVVINKASGVFNFAHGAMMMMSAYIFFAFFSSSQIWLAAAIALSTATVLMVVTTGSWSALRKPQVLAGSVAAIVVLSFLMTFRPEDGVNLGIVQLTSTSWINAVVGAGTGTILIGVLIERFTIRPLIGQPIFAAVMVTLALAEIVRGLTTLIWGPQPKSLTIFGIENAFVPGTYSRLNAKYTLPTENLLGGDILIDQPRMFAFIIALLAFAAFFLLFRFTNIGLAMRATSEDQQLAESVGLRVRVILAVTWAVAAIMAGIAALMQVGASDSNSLTTDLQFIALRAFPAVLLGGLESITGALIGGLVLGLTEEWAKMLFGGEVATELAPYVLLMVVLVLRPEGLFGERRIERI